MTSIVSAPPWFFGFDTLFEIVFALVTFFVAFLSYKAYKLTGKRNSLLFTYAFLFIGVSYLAQAAIHVLMYFRIRQTLETSVILLPTYRDLLNLNLWGAFAHVLFMLLGLVLLICMSCNACGGKMISLIFILVFAATLFAWNYVWLFYALSSIFLIYIILHFYRNYRKKKNKYALLPFLAFTLLLATSVMFIFARDSSLLYVIAHIVELVAYMLIAINLLHVLRK